MKTRLATVVIGVFALSLVGNAQTQTEGTEQSSYIDPVAGLTLDDAITRALEREPTLRASRSRVNVTRGIREQAGLRPNPSFSFSQQQEPAGTDNQTRVELQWPL